jgi:hypothetical protein
MTKLSLTTSISAIAIGLLTLANASLAQAQPIYIKAQHSGKCLHIPASSGNSFANGIQLTQWQCIPQRNVQWELENVGAPEQPVYRIKSISTGKCAQVNGGSKANGAVISQWDCVKQPNVHWVLQPVGDNFVNIVNLQTNKCLQVDGLSQSNNAPISQWDCVDQPNVKWKIVNAPQS